MKFVQIKYELFLDLIKYHLADVFEREDEIKKELEDKLNSIILRDLYTKYKTAPTKQEREEARQKYLDEKGYFNDFRW